MMLSLLSRRVAHFSVFLYLSLFYSLAQSEVSDATLEKLIERIEQLEERLAEYEKLLPVEDEIVGPPQTAESSTEKDLEPADIESRWVGTKGDYAYIMLDHAENITNRQEVLIDFINSGTFPSRFIFGGQITAIANYQTADEDSKFGWLMRHPTSANQVGETVSEAVVHSANLNVTASLGKNWHAYVELFYNPQQNFAAQSSITGLPRNNVNVRRAYVLYNDTQDNDFYASIGKMDIPYGLNDTVSPFTNSSSWHAFAGIAYGATAGYLNDSWHARFMAIQGGAQFRNANTSIKGTNVPSKLNNFAIDVRRTFAMEGGDNTLMVGASYQLGSSYCQEFPIKHFGACEDDNPAIAVYAKYNYGKGIIIADYAETLDVWPGTLNPALPEFPAEEVIAFTLGVRHGFDAGYINPVELSFEFSRFEAGPSDSEWERVNQWVLGTSYFVNPQINLFAELSRTEGWAPLNFLTGGNCEGPNPLCDQMGPAGVWTDKDSDTDVFLLGVQVGF